MSWKKYYYEIGKKYSYAQEKMESIEITALFS